jgi:DNA-directed RNA polymerase subunit RPC12/RpoP
MGDLALLARTLDQELLALLRGASLECLVCGEFVQHHVGGAITCPECGSGLLPEVKAKPAAANVGMVC